MYTERQLRIKERMVDEDFIGYLKDILENNQLYDSPAAEGIAKKVVAEGTIANLSEKQVHTLIVYGVDVDGNYIKGCGICGEELPWCEMAYGAYIERCSVHQDVE